MIRRASAFALAGALLLGACTPTFTSFGLASTAWKP